jgi:hypothetical protein
MAMVRVGALSGIGTRVAKRLQALGVFTTADLLRVERRRLDRQLAGATIAEILAWQQVAELLEVESMTLPLAEGLHASGIETVDELGAKSLSALRSSIDELRSDGVTVGAWSDDRLVEMLKDAVVLRTTGTLNGTVVGPKGGPVSGVEVACLGIATKTDARGRFRIRRLPLRNPVLVSLSRSGYASRVVETSQVVPSGVLAGDSFPMFRTKPGRAAPPTVLSELAGDEVPPLGSAPFTLRVQSAAPARNDLLAVNERLDGGAVRAVSRLFDFDGTYHVVRVYRLTPSRIRGRAKVGDHLQYVDGKWKPVDLTPQEVASYRRKVRELRTWRRLPKTPTAAEFDQALAGWTAARTTPKKGPG